MIDLGKAFGPPLVCAMLFVPNAALAQVGEVAPIDQDLRGNLDFRDVAFEACFGQQQCFAQGVTITAARRETDGVTWTTAEIYWDPIDGLGVLGGGQNDEIDFDERLTVTFEGTKGGTVNIERVWLSDLFIGESERYSSSEPADSEDVEVAIIQSFFANEMVSEAIVDGTNVLPPDPFNAEVIAGHREDGDFFRRIVVQDGMMSVDVLSARGTGPQEMLRFPIGEIDEERRLDLFEGLETVEVDLTDILAGFNDVPFYPAGTVNADIIASVLDEQEALLSINRAAQQNRVVSSVSNGELGVDMDVSIDVETLVFMSALGVSNDYSVAGIVLPEVGGQ